MGGNLEECLRGFLVAATPPSTSGSSSPLGGRRASFSAGSGVLTDDTALALTAGEYAIFVGHLVLKRASIPQETLQQIAVVLSPHVEPQSAELLAEVACKTADMPLSLPKALRTLLAMLGSSSSSHADSKHMIPSYFSQRLACQRGLADAMRTELHSWGQADNYLSFAKDGNGSLRIGAVPRAPRGYTVAMWLCMDEQGHERRRDPVVLYRFASGKPMSGVEVSLEYWGDDIWQLIYKSLIPGSNDNALVARTAVSFTRGTWQLLTISHSLPYLAYMNIKKSQVRIMLDTHMIGHYDVPYPVPSTADQREAETFRHNTVAEHFVGRLAGLTMYMDVLSDELVQLLYRAGPNHPNLASPVPVPCDHVEDPVMRLGSEFCQGNAAEAGARVPISFSLHAQWTRRTGSDACVLIPQVGSNKLDHLTLVKPGHFRAIGLDVSPLVHIIGGIKLCKTDFAYESFAAVGGVRTLLTLASEDADRAHEPSYLVSLVLLVAEFLSRHVAYREHFLQCYGFHVISSILKKKTIASSTLDTVAVDACLTILDACGGEQGGQLFWAGVQGLFFDWDLWGRASGATQIYLLERVMEIASRNVAAFRECVGVQNLLDLLRLHICASSSTTTPVPVSTTISPLSGAQLFDMASVANYMAGPTLGFKRQVLERADQVRLVEMCEPLLVAVIEQGFLSRPLIEEGWDASLEAAKGDVQPLLRCLHETRSNIVLAAVLRALVSIRAAHGDLLWRDLVRLGFDRTTCYLLLTRRGYNEDVRRLTLDLFVWIVETAAATPGKIAAYVSLSEGRKDTDGALTNFDEHQATRAEEDVAAYLENFHKLGEIVTWLAQGVSAAVEGGSWSTRLGQDTIEVLAGEEDRQRPIWVVLPFLAAILPLAPTQAQQFAMMKVNMRLKVEERSRKEILTAGLDFWLTTLIGLASLGADDDLKPQQGGSGSVQSPAMGGSGKSLSGGGGRPADDWQAVQGFGAGAVADATVQDMAHIVEELALDALATLLHDEMSRNVTSSGSSGDRAPAPPVSLWQRLADEISKVDDQEAGLRSWSDVALQRLCAMVLQRIARSGTLFNAHTMKTVLTLLSIIEERIFPLNLEPSTALPPQELMEAERRDDAASLISTDDDFSVVGDKQAATSSLSPGEVRLLFVICELVRYLRNGATATSSNGRLTNAESSYVPALLLSFRILMALIGKMTSAQAQSAVQEMSGILYILLSSKTFDPAAASDMVMLLMAALRQAVDQLKSQDPRDEELLQVYTTLAIVVVNDYALASPIPPPVANRGRSTSHAIEAFELPCRQAVGRLLSPAIDEVSSDAIFDKLRDPMEKALRDLVEEQEGILDRLGSQSGYGMDSSLPMDETTRSHKRRPSHGPPVVETRSDQLTKEFTQQHRQALDLERARLANALKTLVEGFHAVDSYWEQVCRMTRWEARALPPKPKEICWSLETEQGLLMARRRVLLTHSSFGGLQEPQKTTSAPLSPRSAATKTIEHKKSLTAGGGVDGEKVGIALALQFGDKIRDVTAEAVGKDDEAKDGSWDVVDGGEFKGPKDVGKDLLEAPLPEIETEYDDEEDDEDDAEGRKGAAVRDEGTKAAVVDMGLRTRDDRRIGGPERRTGHDGRPYHDSELLREDNVTMVTPRRQYRGTLLLTESYLYFFRAFTPEDVAGARGTDTPSIAGRSPQFIKDEEQLLAEENAADGFSRERWVLANVTGMFVRRYRLRDTAMEVFFRLGRKRSMFIDFGRLKEDTARRDKFLIKMFSRVSKSAWRQWPKVPIEWLLKGYRITEAWQRREISNYDYLMALNTIAGRSFNDLSQYPVFPWVLSNYTSSTIDLSNPANYRDLRKPMGALNEERLAEFMERYETFQDPNIPKFMYGSHYSTAAGVVLHYLVRLQPYATLHREMQGGDFDVADRLFSSIPRSWRMNTSDLSEVKELTPEWYSMPDFLRNLNNFDMGETQDGGEVGDVELPPWAPTAEDFIRIQREALESEHVSQNIHHWIDLIFGYKQRGPAALEARNVFFYLTYYGAVDVSQIEDEALRRATEMQIAYFGQCPIQLFSRPHPAREPCPVIYRPLSSLLRQRFNVPTEAITPEQRAVWELPEPVSVQEADNHIIHVKVLRNRILTINENGVVSSYSWNCLLRTLERDRLAPVAGETVEGDAGWAGLEVQPGYPASSLARGPSPAPRTGPAYYQLALNECISSSNSHASTSPSTTPTHAHASERKAGSPTDASSPVRARRSADEAPSPRRPARSDPRVQILRLLVERDRTAIESVPRIPPSVFAERGGSFPVHISRTGRFSFGGGDLFGSVHVIEMDVLEGKITGETTLQGHTAAVTCFASADLEETGMELLLTGAKDCLGMLWCMQRINAKTKKPYIFKRPDHILYGHSGPIVSCAVSANLGVALTASQSEVLVHSIDGMGLIRRISIPAALAARGFRLEHCLLSDEGFFVVTMSGKPSDSSRPGTPVSSSGDVARVQVWTVNGNIVAERETPFTIRHVKMVGRGNVIMVAGSEGSVEFFDLMELDLVGSYRLDWAQYGAGTGGGRASPGSRGPTELVCVDAGPDAVTPVLLACGTNHGSLVVVGLPLLHHLRDLESAKGFADTLLNVPIKIVKDTVNIALNTIGKARGIGTTVKGVAVEAFGEVSQLATDVRKKGISGLVGYFRQKL